MLHLPFTGRSDKIQNSTYEWRNNQKINLMLLLQWNVLSKTTRCCLFYVHLRCGNFWRVCKIWLCKFFKCECIPTPNSSQHHFFGFVQRTTALMNPFLTHTLKPNNNIYYVGNFLLFIKMANFAKYIQHSFKCKKIFLLGN